MKKIITLTIFAFCLFCHARAMQIFVKKPDNIHTTIECDSTDRIEDIKNELTEKGDFSYDQIILIFSDKVLEDDKTLQDYSIQKDNELLIILQKTTTEDNETYYVVNNIISWSNVMLNILPSNPNANIKLEADILCNDTTNWNNWGTSAPANTSTPIGDMFGPYTGTFDGNGHTIFGLYINEESGADVGLFGITSGATIENLSISKSYIKGPTRVGGIVGHPKNNTQIRQCHFSGIVEANSTAGGIVGNNNGSHIEQCSNSGTINGGSPSIGGIAGSSDGTIINCYNTGNIIGTRNSTGGIAGETSMGEVSHCFNTGTINGVNSTGAIVGNNSNATIEYSYYLTGSATKGVGNDPMNKSSHIESYESEQFANGTITWLLQNGQTEEIWSQDLTSDIFPTFSADTTESKIYMFTLINEDNTDSLFVNSGNYILPIPEKNGYTFAGWFDAPEEGNKITDNQPLEADMTLYARFKENGPSTDVLPTTSTSWHIISHEGVLNIEGYEDTMNIYNANGSLLYEGHCPSPRLEAGFYIIRLGNETQKVIVK